MNICVLLALSGLASDCEESRTPWWLPGKEVAHNEVGSVYGSDGLSLLCCNGKIGGIPEDPKSIAHWKTYMGKQYAVLATSEANCARDQELPGIPPPPPPLSSASTNACPQRKHFPSVPVGECSGAFNPDTRLAEFAKCCPTKRLGEHGEIHSTGAGMWVYSTEASCRMAKCSVSVYYECPSVKDYAFVDLNGTVQCGVLPRIKEYEAQSYKSCGWDDLQARIGSSDSLPRCLEECSSRKECRSVELHIGVPSLCILRSETCARTKADNNVHTYIKREMSEHSGFRHTPHHVVLIVILASAIVGLTLLMGSIFFKEKE